ncbi:glycosyltransferase family 2 protein [Qipengyuania spongiae]|uniref:Glycosyltransferase family 2 protein n=1 Tax=Qipengyuania spongiae TaxID=2909673 RepID=A0ABY5T6E7_9SPHN|nr:glycosyltransferase family 2 protein [Qipengyuania spongiae]UVI40861.1 glycosyltransferase family 2 protein [Qipengyuania spongiae]
MNAINTLSPFDTISHVKSELVWESGRAGSSTRATIAIPTYKRFDTLLEAIASALAQTGVEPPDIVIVDNEGHGDKPAAVWERLEKVGDCRIRYFVNPQNLGMFGNWNRCIQLSETPWLTILNDDDLLRPQFLKRSLLLTDRLPKADGVICRKGTKDRRAFPPITTQPGFRQRLNGAIGKALGGMAFRKGVLKVDARRLFFGNFIGNGAGFLFRKETAIKLGGYDPKEWPAADFFFYVRMVLEGELFLLDEELADVGLGDNESLSPEVLSHFVEQLHHIRMKLAGNAVPARWSAMAPQLAANHILYAARAWGVRLDPGVIGEALGGLNLPPPNPRREYIWRLLHGTF